MLATVHFGASPSAHDDWFDTILDVDTKLFLDPFLVFKESEGRWASAHDQLITHFNRAFLLIAKGGLKPESLAYEKALELLVFKEPRELCLGYTREGTSGAGSGRGLARLVARAIVAAIERGLSNPRHFEELGVLQEGIGTDRISDIACTILKPDLISYTQDVAARHGIPLLRHPIYASEFDVARQRFQTKAVAVPTNPMTSGPLLFVPRRFLSQLPALNDRDWWDHYQTEQLRRDLNYEVMTNVDKRTIVAHARANLESVRAWAAKREGSARRPYDFPRDPAGVVQWEPAANAFTEAHPLVFPGATDQASFIAVVEKVVDQFRLFVEERSGWTLLWNRADEKPEHAAQVLFYGIARNYCTANGIVVDREPDLGRGPVDFKFSNGYRLRAHLEVKKLHNGKFWNGLDSQLPSYLASDEVDLGWFLAIRYRSGMNWDAREAQLPGRVQAAGQRHGRTLRSAMIDARPQPSASRQLAPAT